MRTNFETRWIRYYGVALVILSCAIARGELKIDEPLDEISLKDTSGRDVTVRRTEGGLELRLPDGVARPKGLAIHLFQPDCLQCQAQLQALNVLYRELGKDGFCVLGISHRGGAKETHDIGESFELTFPLLVGRDSDFAKRFASGDAFCMVDGAGTVRYVQVGYGKGDEERWTENARNLIAGKPVAYRDVGRDRLKAGDRFPAVELDALMTGKPIRLAGHEGRLVYQGEDEKTVRPRAALGFFTRY